MNDNQLAVLAAWLQKSRLTQVIAYANSIGIEIDAMDCVKLFHYVNDQRSNENERNAISL